jgi:hypothetical protein
VADDRTTVTELVTGLGTLGFDTIDDALRGRPPEMVSVSPELWQRLDELRDGRAHDLAFEAAWANGVALLKADDGLRERRPRTVEWRGGAKAVDDELVPIDLRIDRVFLVSCKYLSKVVANVAPARLFDGLLRVRTPAEQLSWFAAVAPAEHSNLLAAAMRHAGLSGELSQADRRRLRDSLRGARWPDSCAEAWDDLVGRVSTSSAARWRSAIKGPTDALRLFWRLVRIGPAPYFVLGVSDARPLRLGVVTTWDWQQRFDLADLNVAARPAGQPVVDWVAVIRDRRSKRTSEIAGHVEIRWSHGRFNGAPEAKVYLDAPHDSVPGYVQLR